MKPIAVFMPWWGPAPGWEPEFLERASEIRSMVPILVGDAAGWMPKISVPRIPCTMDECERKASEVAGVKIHKNNPGMCRGQSVCELKPLMADMYPNVIEDTEWWGYGDWDVVWGDWDSFLTEDRLSQYDAISSSSYSINGPLQLFRNKPEINALYRKRLDWLADTRTHYLDESGMQEIVSAEPWVRRLYPADLDGADRRELWNRCVLRDGKLYRMDQDGNIGAEILTFHFPGTNRWPL